MKVIKFRVIFNGLCSGTSDLILLFRYLQFQLPITSPTYRIGPNRKWLSVLALDRIPFGGGIKVKTVAVQPSNGDAENIPPISVIRYFNLTTA